MKSIKLVSLILAIAILASLLLSCNANSNAEPSHSAASAQASIFQPNASVSPSSSDIQGQPASGLPMVSASLSPSQTRAVLPDDDPNVTGSESALITDQNGILKNLPIKTNVQDGQYTGIIGHLFTLDQGQAVDFDQISVSDGEISNDTNAVVFFLLNSTISYSLPDGTKKANVSSNEISDLAKNLTTNYYFTVTLFNSKVTDITYGGKAK